MPLVLVLVVFVGCAASTSPVNHCPAPTMQQFSCEPIPAGSVGCVGGCGSACGVIDKTADQEADETFPVGCVATLTVCEPEYPDEALNCNCEMNADGSAGWGGGGGW